MANVTVAEIETAIANLVAQAKWDYKNGNFEINKSDQMLALIKARESMLASPDIEIDVMAFDFDIDIFGSNKTQIEPGMS